MKKSILAAGLALAVLAGVQADDAADKEARRAKMRERRARMYALTGGRLDKPGSRQGAIRFVTSVKEVDATVLSAQYARFAKAYPYDIAAVVGEAVTVESAAAAKAKAGAAIAVFIVDSAHSAPMIAAPEEGWAIVNSRACGTPERTAKEAVKAFATIAGAVNGNYGMTFLSSTRPQELDSVATIDVPVDVSERIKKQLALLGVSPLIRTTYRQACEEGWAPSPTNDVEKAIWSEVHAVPQKPIKIEYNEKRDKGK